MAENQQQRDQDQQNLQQPRESGQPQDANLGETERRFDQGQDDDVRRDAQGAEGEDTDEDIDDDEDESDTDDSSGVAADQDR